MTALTDQDISKAFYNASEYSKEVWSNPNYLFKKKHYTRKKRLALRAKHRRDLAEGKYGLEPISQEIIALTIKHPNWLSDIFK